MLRNTVLIFALPLLFIACGPGENTPDVSNIKVDIQTLRFEKDFFAMDTNQMPASFAALAKKYPFFAGQFTEMILGIPMQDTSGMKF